jgi:hypothetical protein
MKRMRDESGQAAIMAVLGLTCILGFVGFATDVGVLLHAKRNLQIAADAAALAGANEITIDSTQIVAAGKAASATNGFTDGSNSVTVAINNPPSLGPHATGPNKAIYVEAIVTQTQPTFFMRVLGFTSMPVSARAVAFNGANNGSGCLHALNGSAPDTINLQGHFTVDAPGCQVLDNSTDPCGLDFTGNAGNLTAGSVSVAGGACGHESDSNPAPTVDAPQVSDPLANSYTPIPQSSWPACTAAPSGNTWGTSGGKTYNPSGSNPTTLFCYSSGTNSVNNAVTMQAGTYIFTGSLGLQGHGSLDGTAGVTIYLAAPNGNMNMGGSGNSNLSLTAPSTGPFANVAIYEEPTDTNPVNMEGTPITGIGAGAGLTGIIYLPNAMLELGGNSTTQVLTTDLIVNKLFVFGNATVNISDDSVTHNTPLHTIALVE